MKIDKNLNRSEILFLFACFSIIVCAIFLRFFRLQGQGYFFHDEAMMYNRALILKSFLWSQHPVLKMTAIYYDSKILWEGFLVIAQLIFGSVEWSAQFVSAFFGVLTVLMTFFFAKRYYGCQSRALVSALFLSVSSYHVFYSRLALAESAGIFFFLASLFVYLFADGRNQKIIVLAGILGGCAFLINRYRIITLPVFILIFLIYRIIEKKSDPQKSAVAFGVYIGSFVITVLSYQGLYSICSLFGFYIPSYFYALSLSAGMHMWTGVTLSDFLSYPFFILRFEGIGIAALLVTSVFFIRRRKNTLPFVICIVTQILFCTFVDDRGARNISVILPFIAVVCADTVFVICERIKKPMLSRVVCTVILAVVVIGGVHKSLGVTKFRSDIAQAMKELNQRFNTPRIVSFNPVALMYSPQGLLLDFVQTGYTKELFAEAGYDFFVIDPQVHIVADQFKSAAGMDHLTNLVRDVSDNCPLTLKYSHFSEGLMQRHIMEHNRNFAEMKQLLKNRGGDSGELRIYSLSKCRTD